jgi:hypothetical protein
MLHARFRWTGRGKRAVTWPTSQVRTVETVISGFSCLISVQSVEKINFEITIKAEYPL